MQKHWKEADLLDAQVSWVLFSSKIKSPAEDKYAFTFGDSLINFDVTSAIAGMVDGTIGNNGFMITTSHNVNTSRGWGGVWSAWHSSESDTISRRPTLIVTYEAGVTNIGVSSLTTVKNYLVNDLTTDRLFLSNVASGNYDISIFDISGRKLIFFSKELFSNAIINLGNTKLHRGAYIVKIKGANGNFVSYNIVQ